MILFNTNSYLDFVFTAFILQIGDKLPVTRHQASHGSSRFLFVLPIQQGTPLFVGELTGQDHNPVDEGPDT